ncbi:MAG: AbrB/MazE/SpoVT family DNA-binding domain-containing protein [Candidatus Omnitrophica bacterium]|nr:AbrB/MazE/SpoVT family DNA-binding domain-containing protein [Candidatus Omnitrophota bacterium]
MVIAESQITAKRQITIPMTIMKKLHLHPGDGLSFDEKDGQIHVVPKKSSNINDLFLRFSPKTKIRLTEEQLRKARQEIWGERYETRR